PPPRRESGRGRARADRPADSPPHYAVRPGPVPEAPHKYGPSRTAGPDRGPPPPPPAAPPPVTISGPPAATATGPSPAASAWRNTRTIIGTPPISARGFAGSRVEARRAGIRRIGFMSPFRGPGCGF